MNIIETKNLGIFQVTSGRIKVSDPCYDNDVWCSGDFLAQNGEWIAEAVFTNENDWGVRVAELRIRHKDAVINDNWVEAGHVGVDSGQCGFWDYDRWVSEGCGRGSRREVGSFYDRIIDLTLGTERWDAEKGMGVLDQSYGGVIEWGAVTRSGYGDGGYFFEVQMDEKNEVVVAARLVYICDECDEDEEDEDEEEYSESYEEEISING